MDMNTDKRLTLPQRRVMNAIIETGGGSITTVSHHLFVSYQCVANRLSEMYDDLHDVLGDNTTIQALVVWYYKTNFPRVIGSSCLLWLFCTYTFCNVDNEIMARRARRGRRSEYEYITENE